MGKGGQAHLVVAKRKKGGVQKLLGSGEWGL